MRKFIGLLAVVAVAVCALASVASASSNYPNGTTVTGTNSGNISLSGVVTCGTSNTSGTLSNNGAGLGADISLSSATFSSCNTPVASCKMPWTIHTTSGGPTVWTGSITNVCVDLTSLGCRYEGTLTGGSFDESTDLLTLSGSLSKTSGGFVCPSSGSTVGKYTTTPTDLDLS